MTPRAGTAAVLARDLPEATAVRFAELEPRWTTSRATEPGYFRWLVSYLGGPTGNVNPSPETGILSDDVVVGVMGIPAGNRQHGFHVHTVREIYVVLRGILRSLGPGTDHIAGPLDCLDIPAGAPHGVEVLGDDDALFLWLHDRVEPEGVSVYYESLESAPPGEAPIQLVPWASLPSRRDDAEGGHLHERRTWVGNGVVLESLRIEPANAERPRSSDSLEIGVVIAGEATIRGAGCGARLKMLDAVVIPPGIESAFAASAVEPAHLVVIRG